MKGITYQGWREPNLRTDEHVVMDMALDEAYFVCCVNYMNEFHHAA